MAGMLSPTTRSTGGPIRALHNSTMSSIGRSETHLASPHQRTLVLEDLHQQNMQKMSKNLQYEFD